jgi:hypothetical protein
LFSGAEAPPGGPMLEGKNAQEWIDLYLDTKPAELRDVAEQLRKLMKMKKTVKSAKESVNSWKIPTYECNGRCAFSWLENIM